MIVASLIISLDLNSINMADTCTTLEYECDRCTKDRKVILQIMHKQSNNVSRSNIKVPFQ